MKAKLMHDLLELRNLLLSRECCSYAEKSLRVPVHDSRGGERYSPSAAAAGLTVRRAVKLVEAVFSLRSVADIVMSA